MKAEIIWQAALYYKANIPTAGTKVLVATAVCSTSPPFEEHHAVREARYDGINWCASDGELSQAARIDGVYAWAELPTPPPYRR